MAIVNIDDSGDSSSSSEEPQWKSGWKIIQSFHPNMGMHVEKWRVQEVKAFKSFENMSNFYRTIFFLHPHICFQHPIRKW